MSAEEEPTANTGEPTTAVPISELTPESEDKKSGCLTIAVILGTTIIVLFMLLFPLVMAGSK